MSAETVEVHEHGKPRRAPVELVGVVRHDENAGHRRLGLDRYADLRTGEILAPLRPGDSLLARCSPFEGDPFHAGMARVGPAGSIDLSGITCLAVGDYIYRIGKPLTPSLEERIEAIERLLGMVADDLEVANDADLAGQREAAAAVRADAIRRIRESVPRTPSRGTLPL